MPENFQEVPEKVTSHEVQVDDEAQEELLLPSESLEAGSWRSKRIRTSRRNERQKMKKTCTRWTSEEDDALRLARHLNVWQRMSSNVLLLLDVSKQNRHDIGGSKMEMEKDDKVHNRGRKQKPSLFITITEAQNTVPMVFKT